MKRTLFEYAKNTAGAAAFCAASFFSAYDLERRKAALLRRNPNAEVETCFRQIGGLGGYWEVREKEPTPSLTKPK